MMFKFLLGSLVIPINFTVFRTLSTILSFFQTVLVNWMSLKEPRDFKGIVQTYILIYFYTVAKSI